MNWDVSRLMSRVVCVGVSVFALTINSAAAQDAHSKQANDGSIQTKFSQLPLAFEDNQGQADAAVKFLARGPGYRIFLTAREAVLAFDARAGRQHRRRESSGEAEDSASDQQGINVIRMSFKGAAQRPTVSASDPLPYRTNYFFGDLPSQNVTDVKIHARVKYTSIYPGIDVVYYGHQDQLEYDLLLAPRADPRKIRLDFAGAKGISASSKGGLILKTEGREITFRKPAAYQEAGGKRENVDAEYVVASNEEIGFRLGKYDINKPLIIDPILSYSSFLWSGASGVAVDSQGNAYVSGSTTAIDLPASTGYQTKIAGTQDAYVVKLDSSGTKVIYGTYLGVRRSVTGANGIGVDGSGNAIIFGTTNSASFPTTAGALQRTYSTGSSFVTKLNAIGNALVYSTFVTGANIKALALDGSGNSFLAGAPGTGFTTTSGAYNRTSGGCILAKLNAAGSAMIYATYFGGGSDSCSAVAIDPTGNAYLSGTASANDLPVTSAAQSTYQGKKEAFAAKLNASGSALLYATYLGGTQDDLGNAIAVNAAGEAFVVGRTHSSDFPVTLGSFQQRKGDASFNLSGDRSQIANAFITKLNNTGTTMLYSSYLGGAWCFDSTRYTCGAGPGIDEAARVAVDAAGYAYVGGYAISTLFPVRDSIEPVVGDDTGTVPFVTKVAPLGDRLVYSAVVGSRYAGAVWGLAIDPAGSVYAIGNNAGDPVYPLTAGMPLSQSGTSFILKLSPGKYSTAIRSSNLNALTSEAITFSADVETPTAGGTVSFMDGTTTLGTANLVNGSASISVFLSAGAHKITATYSLDGKVSAPIYQVVMSP